MDDNIAKNVQELNDKRTRYEILSQCIKELQIKRNTIWQFIICPILSLIIGVCVAFKSNALEISQNIMSMFLDVSLALFAVILGAYAVFQALMRDEIIKELIKSKDNILRISNRTFLNLSLLHIINIFITVFVSILVMICDDEFYIYSILFSNIAYAVLLTAYCTFNFLIILENINFVINLYRMFNVYNIYRALDVVDKE